MELTLDALQRVKQNLESMTAQSPELEDNILWSKLLVRHLYPEQSEDFNLVAVEPSKTTSNFLWPGGTKEEFEVFTRRAVEQQSQRIDQMRLEVIQMIEDLLRSK